MKLKVVEGLLTVITLINKVVKILAANNLRICFCRMVVVLEASVQGALEDRTRVALNPHMGAPTGAPTEGR